MSGWELSLSPTVGERSAIYPSALKEEGGSVREDPKRGEFSFFFSRKLFPREQPPFLLASLDLLRASLRNTGRLSISIEYRAANDGNSDSRFVCRKRSEFSREVFPPSSREHRHRRSRLTCCRITGSTLAACPLASYLSSSPPISPFSDHYSAPGATDERNRMSHGGTRRWNWSGRKHLD